MHVDPSWLCCQKALKWTETLNTRIQNQNESGPSTPKVYHQQLPYVDAWELPNPLLVGQHFINNDPYYENHDPDLDIDDDWFQ